mmetsp:Transcript_17975/g.26679  ORF Transcript_17975/g.26679 Transcript_17975/m.26679 type:complete len:157 (+) Transcript_17975:199-669(+)
MLSKTHPLSRHPTTCQQDLSMMKRKTTCFNNLKYKNSCLKRAANSCPLVDQKDASKNERMNNCSELNNGANRRYLCFPRGNATISVCHHMCALPYTVSLLSTFIYSFYPDVYDYHTHHNTIKATISNPNYQTKMYLLFAPTTITITQDLSPNSVND